MPPMIFWFNVAVGALCMFVARRAWLRRTKDGSRARRWQSVMYIALGLGAWVSAGLYLAAPPVAGFWYILLYAAITVVLTSAIVSWIYLSGERYLARQRDIDDQPGRPA